jgi:hypothetical protein
VDAAVAQVVHLVVVVVAELLPSQVALMQNQVALVVVAQYVLYGDRVEVFQTHQQ